MSIHEIEEHVRAVVEDFDKDTFIYNFLLAYGKPKSAITRLQQEGRGSYNLSKVADQVIWKKQLLYKFVDEANLHGWADELSKSDVCAKQATRFVIVTNGSGFVAVDTKTQDTLDTTINELPLKVHFFMPWTGQEKVHNHGEHMADVKASEKMAKLFDLLREDNDISTPEHIHALNIFLSRLLFCYFAEDTEIFDEKQFTDSIQSNTQEDGSDLSAYLKRLFDVMNTKDRTGIPEYLSDFKYVNGGLFADEYEVPTFTKRSRKMLIECGAGLDWSEINPDIFGSMIQAVVHPDHRGTMGMHYTSVPNIKKVIEPLFLNDLKDDFEKSYDSPKKLDALLRRLEHIKIFDPACGSGNFLIIAYKELRKLEIEVFNRLQALVPQLELPLSRIKLNQFYGIELDDFAHEIAILSLWLAEHQMNMEFREKFGQANPALPLNKGGEILCDSSNNVNWLEFCPINDEFEVYILGNPPYLGARTQTDEQKAEMREVLGHLNGVNSLDYISTWFYKGAEFIEAGAQGLGLVSTNSISQGEQVSMLWPHILEEKGLCINFAHTSFKWANNAKNKAGVTCVIIGLSKQNNKKRRLYTDNYYTEVNNISPYLTDSKNIYVHKRTKPLSDLPEMVYGNQPIEGGFLILAPEERDDLLKEAPEAERFIKNLIGGNEFLKGIERFCIWIEDDELDDALAIAPIKRRVDQVRTWRAKGGQVASSLVGRPHQFRYRHRAEKSFLLLPCTSSERREFLQLGFFTSDFLTTHSAQIIYDADPFIFGILSSKAHMLWTKAVGGCLESRIRYSNVLCYNNFPMPKLSTRQKDAIRSCAFEILERREEHSEVMISELYDPEKMPNDLRAAHAQLDQVVNDCYAKSYFKNDEEQLSYLFKIYEDMMEKANA